MQRWMPCARSIACAEKWTLRLEHARKAQLREHACSRRPGGSPRWSSTCGRRRTACAEAGRVRAFARKLPLGEGLALAHSQDARIRRRIGAVCERPNSIELHPLTTSCTHAACCSHSPRHTAVCA
eukprot:1317719-Pleurochrysis_carterae.AAC.2